MTVHRERARTLGATGVALATLLTVTACAASDDDTGPVVKGTVMASTLASPTASASPSASASDAPARKKERITPAGVAAMVSEHLGADTIATVGHFGGDPGMVGVMITLRGGNRADNFAVTLYAPQRGGGEFAELTRCPRGKQARPDGFRKQFRCHRLANGTTVSAYLAPGGFSDDNVHGHVIAGTAGAKDGSVALAMYESYDRSAPVSVTDVDELLSDPRLTWRTDPAVNAAGKSITIHEMGD